MNIERVHSQSSIMKLSSRESTASSQATVVRVPSSSSLSAASNSAATAATSSSSESTANSEELSRTLQITLFIAGWYICSGVTLFGNKHMLSTLHANPDVLAVSQMTITAAMGASKIFGPYLLGGCNPDKIPTTPYTTLSTREFVTDMVMVGVMRVVTVLLGLVSLKFIAVSFTETVKSSAPFFYSDLRPFNARRTNFLNG
eukprot:INCI11860.2.p2 GENE.INCI11860.2~~INCI11860.2.p2  ORF type:complete len:201 (-),score=22.75 INCI11860.2:744-1346(-)